jgi:hypothetical protein
MYLLLAPVAKFPPTLFSPGTGSKEAFPPGIPRTMDSEVIRAWVRAAMVPVLERFVAALAVLLEFWPTLK